MENKQPLIKLPDKIRVELNQLLSDLTAVKDEAIRQQEAGVPEMPAIIDRCDDCIRRIQDFKAVNFPGKK